VKAKRKRRRRAGRVSHAKFPQQYDTKSVYGEDYLNVLDHNIEHEPVRDHPYADGIIIVDGRQHPIIYVYI